MKLAQQTDRWVIVRTLAHREDNHLLATHVALTGRPTGISSGATLIDPLTRPHHLLNGNVISNLYAGATA